MSWYCGLLLTCLLSKRKTLLSASESGEQFRLETVPVNKMGWLSVVFSVLVKSATK
jgi:hypothetical protein